MALPPLDPPTQAAVLAIGEKIRAARLKANLSQETLARSIQMTRTSFARIEKGQTNVTLDSLVRIAHGLDLELTVRFVKKRP